MYESRNCNQTFLNINKQIAKKMIFKNIIGLLFSVSLLLGVNQKIQGQVTDYSQDSVLRKILTDFETYGTLRENFTNLSNRYINNFTALFDKEAVVLNPFTGQLETIREYIEYLKQTFSTGISINIVEYQLESAEYLSSTELLIKSIVMIDYSAYTNDHQKVEESVSVVFHIAYNKYSKIAQITGIREYFISPIEFIEVHLLNPIKPHQSVTDIKVLLVISDSVFQQGIADQFGIVRFFGVPSNKPIKIRLLEGQDFISRRHINIFPDEDDFNPQKPFYLPVFNSFERQSFSTGSRLSCELFFAPYFSALKPGGLFQNENNNINGSTSNKEIGYAVGISMKYRFIKFGNYNLNLSTGWAYDEMAYSISILRLAQIKNKPDINIQMFHFETSGIYETGIIQSLAIPFLFGLEHSSNIHLIRSWEINLGIQLLAPLRGEYNLEGIVKKTSLPRTDLNDYGLVQKSKPSTLIEQNEFNINERIRLNPIGLNFCLTSGISIPLGIEAITLLTRVSMIAGISNTFETNKNDIVSFDLSELNTITGITESLRIIRIGGEIGIRFKIPN